jgi:uncharacterized protein YraI
LLALAPVPTARALGEARVAEDWNLRAGPGLDYPILAVMPAGGTVALTGAEAEGWYAVVFADLPGWVYGEGLILGERAFAPEATVVASLNMRAAPGLDADILTLLGEGARVALIGDPVEADGHTWVAIEGAAAIAGWVAVEYLATDAVP